MKKKAPKPLSRAPDWLCPQCGKPLRDYFSLSLECPDRECGYSHPPFLLLSEAAEVLGISETDVIELAEAGKITLRIRSDRLGRWRRVFFDLRSLWRLRPDAALSITTQQGS